MIAKININKEKNGIEVIFESKPAQAILDSLKSQGFRWSPKQKFWYAKQTAERLAFSASLGDVSEEAPAVVNSINMEGVGSKPYKHAGTELAQDIRAEFKKRGVKGATVRVYHYNSIIITIKATAADLSSIEEAKLRFHYYDFVNCVERTYFHYQDKLITSNLLETMSDEEKQAAYTEYIKYRINRYDDFSIYHRERSRDNWELSSDFYKKCNCIYEIANQWNYNNSDIMTDYFDVGYYLSIDIKHDDFTPRENMTADEKKAYKEEKEREEKEREEAIKAQKEEEERARIASEKYENWRKESETLIYNNIVVEDLEEALYISGILGGHGKESSIDELISNIDDTRQQQAVITRIVNFTDEEAFNRFSQLFIEGFTFLSNKGGAATEDVRMEGITKIWQLNTAQRESVLWYLSDCVLIRLNNIDKYVIDPEGHNYARNVYITNNQPTTPAAPILEKMEKESREKPAFYFPADVKEQAKNIKVGDEITIYQTDGIILNNVYAGSGIVVSVNECKYAQYEGVNIELVNGRKQLSIFIRNGKICLIYKGIKPALPDNLTQRQVSEIMYESFNYDKLIPNLYNYYIEQGEAPILDTWQR